MKNRLHVLGLPWSQTTRRFPTDAFNSNVLKLCDMLMAEGHEVYLYSGDENDAACTEHVQLFTEAERQARYGDWQIAGLMDGEWDPEQMVDFNEAALEEIVKRAQPRDFLMVVSGWSHAPVIEELEGVMAVEWTVGHDGPCLQHRVYPSQAWLHYVSGKQGLSVADPYAAVIPHQIDPDDFPAGLPAKDDYLLFMGRLIERKGPHVAAEIARRAGRRLVVAGPGAQGHGPGYVDIVGGGRVECEYAGVVAAEERYDLMARAACVIVPTLYFEPFGLVAIEAMAAGTPVVASDWGAFTETVTPEVGRRFRTLAEGAQAVREAVQLNRGRVRDHALRTWSMDVVAPQFTAYLDRMTTLWDGGWYT